MSLGLVAGFLALAIMGLTACGREQPPSEVFFIEPQSGAQVHSPFLVKMGTRGLTVEPAAEDVDYPQGHGHHHIIVDAAMPMLNQPIPQDSVLHLHFGQGQSETLLDLEPGKHTLRLLFAKGDHVPWSPVIADTIEVVVAE